MHYSVLYRELVLRIHFSFGWIYVRDAREAHVQLLQEGIFRITMNTYEFTLGFEQIWTKRVGCGGAQDTGCSLSSVPSKNNRPSKYTLFLYYLPDSRDY